MPELKEEVIKLKEPLKCADACLKNSREMEYEDRLLILKPESLSEDYRYGEFQYFIAKAGFGCYPDKLGTKVFGEFLIDGEDCQFRRNEFYGIADEEKLPPWAKQKMTDYRSRQQEEIRRAKEQMGQQMI